MVTKDVYFDAAGRDTRFYPGHVAELVGKMEEEVECCWSCGRGGCGR